MQNIAFYVALAVFVVLASYYVVEILHLRRQAKSKYKDIYWNLTQIQRALDLINSENADQILTGLELLYALNNPARLKALSRLMELTSSNDLRVARRARKILEVIGQTPALGSAGGDKVAKTA